MLLRYWFHLYNKFKNIKQIINKKRKLFTYYKLLIFQFILLFEIYLNFKYYKYFICSILKYLIKPAIIYGFISQTSYMLIINLFFR